MKSLTTFLVSLSMISFFAASSGTAEITFIRSSKGEVPSMVIDGLEDYRGKLLTVFYLDARPPIVGMSGTSLHVRGQGLKPQTKTIDDSSLQFSKKKFDKKITYVAIVIHEQTLPQDVAQGDKFASLVDLTEDLQIQSTGWIRFKDFTRLAAHEDGNRHLSFLALKKN